MANTKRPDAWSEQFSGMPEDDEDQVGFDEADAEEEEEEASSSGRKMQLPPVDDFDSLEDVLDYNKKVLRYLAAGKIDGKAISAYSRLAHIVINSRKTQAAVGALGSGDDIPDLTAIRARPDIEAARPLMVQAADFRGMTDEQRRTFFEGLQSIARVGNGNGHSEPEEDLDTLLDL